MEHEGNLSFGLTLQPLVQKECAISLFLHFITPESHGEKQKSAQLPFRNLTIFADVPWFC